MEMGLIQDHCMVMYDAVIFNRYLPVYGVQIRDESMRVSVVWVYIDVTATTRRVAPGQPPKVLPTIIPMRGDSTVANGVIR